jgi:hypothetical protein
VFDLRAGPGGANRRDPAGVLLPTNETPKHQRLVTKRMIARPTAFANPFTAPSGRESSTRAGLTDARHETGQADVRLDWWRGRVA